MRTPLPSAVLPALAALSLPLAGATAEAEAQALAQSNFRELLAWLQGSIEEAGFSGQHLPLEETFTLTFGPYGRSLASKRNLADGELLALLPGRCIIYDRDYARQEGLEGLEPWQEAAVFLVRQRAAGKSSPWAAYMRMLPESFPDLPKHWDDELLSEHLQGSTFPESIRDAREETRRDWEVLREAANVSWEDYEWASDTMETRAAFWNGTEREGSVTPRRTGTSALYPLWDLMPHGQESNIAYSFDQELQVLRMSAKGPVLEGQLLFISYFSRQHTTYVFRKWGFVPEDSKQIASITLGAQSFGLEMDLQDGASIAFLSMLRARAANNRPIPVPRELPEGLLAVADPATGWVYWWNISSGETSWLLPGDPDRPYMTPPTTWNIEARALAEAWTVLDAALARFPQSLTEDKALLAKGVPDARVRHMVLLRRGEKEVLTWWLALVERALRLEGAPEEQVDADLIYAEPGHSSSHHTPLEL